MKTGNVTTPNERNQGIPTHKGNLGSQTKEHGGQGAPTSETGSEEQYGKQKASYRRDGVQSKYRGKQEAFTKD